MKLRQKQILLLFSLFIAFSSVSFAQDEMPDTTMEKLILTVFDKDLNRTEQLEVLDKALGEKFDLAYELKLLLQNMDSETKKELMRYTYRRANKPVPASGPVAKIYWKDIEHNFGTVSRGQTVTKIFNFTNIGKIPYTIKDIEGSCGCTVAEYTESLIPPGGKGKIVVKFNSTGKSGENTEFVTVIGNSYPSKVVLVISANVK